MATQHFLNWVEGRAERLRARCGLSPFAQLNPFRLAATMDVPVLYPREIEGVDGDVIDHVLNTGGREWDAATVPVAGVGHVIVMNPGPCSERQRASLMEELAHIDLGHKPGGFRTVGRLVLREWKQSHETEAYWVGAAALVPRRLVKGAITRGITVAAVAKECGVSQALVGFRERVLGVKFLRPEPTGAANPQGSRV
jgi:hypothetical protein